jgi:hypothetical protein
MARALLSCITTLCSATGALSSPDSRISYTTANIDMQRQALLSSLQRLYPQISWEMVGVVATLCSIVPGFWWLMRTRTSLSSSSGATSEVNGGVVGRTVDTNGKLLLALNSSNCTDQGRCRSNRSGTSEETFGIQVFHDQPIYVSEPPRVLPAPYTSRQAPSEPSFTSSGLHSRSRRLDCSIRQPVD